MFRRSAVVVAVVALTLAAGACSSDDGNDGSVDGVDTIAVVGDSSAPVDSGGTGATPGGAIDCAAVESAFGALIVNTQVVLRLAGKPDVTQWTNNVGTMDQFATQLATLRALEPYGDDVKASIDFFAGANDIVQRGFAGDTDAAAELASYVGVDFGAALAKRAPLALAFGAAGC